MSVAMRHESAAFSLVNGSWVARCVCGWEDERRYGTHGAALRTYLREHSDMITLREHYV